MIKFRKSVFIIIFVFLNLIFIDKLFAVDALPDDGAIITSAEVVQIKTGTGPWDSDDTQGNDSSQDNDIVRSFDQVTYTIENTFGIKNNESKTYSGGKVYFSATLPEIFKDKTAVWDTDSMVWASDLTVSSDGLTVTGYYQMDEENITVPGKQNLVFVVKVLGAQNGTTFTPTINLWLNGNDSTQYQTVIPANTIVSAIGKYNIRLGARGSGNGSYETQMTDSDGNSVKGQVFLYAAQLELYGDNQDKGLKGVEFPTGKISYDINLKLTRTNRSTRVTEDITDSATPVIFNFSKNGSGDDTKNGIPFKIGSYFVYGNRNIYTKASSTVLGNSVYKSGTFTCTQEGSVLKVENTGYNFDGYFPVRNASRATDYVDYTSNIGNFSVFFFQVFVPYNDETSSTNYTYDLTIEDSNLSATSLSNETITTQKVTTDDKSVLRFTRYRSGSYWHDHYIYTDKYKMLHTNWDKGDGVAYIGQKLFVGVEIYCGSGNVTGQDDINSANILVKIDTNAFEAIPELNGVQFRNFQSTVGTYPKFEYKMYYAAKKDGTGWSSITEQQTAKIEELDYYESLTDLENDGKVCVGALFETISGQMTVTTFQIGSFVGMPVKIKDTVSIGSTYQFTSDTRMYATTLDRATESMGVENGAYTTKPTTSWNQTYIKTEYDSSGQIITGTHSPGVKGGNSVLIVGAKQSVQMTAIDSDGNTKQNYDISKNENEVEFKVTPIISNIDQNNVVIDDVTITLTDTLPSGLTYVAGSSNYGEPVLTKNDDGTTTLVWYKTGCTTGEAIDPLTFKASIFDESANGTQYTNHVTLSADSKIGNTPLADRQAEYTIQVINLASHRMYKSVITPVIERNGDIHFSVTYKNSTDDNISNFQLLDILPYNGDSRGTSYTGSYVLKNVEVTEEDSSGNNIDITDALKVLYTDDESSRSATSKDENLGEGWSEASGDINKEAKTIAVIGTVAPQGKLTVDIYLSTSGNKGLDKYVNITEAQIYKTTEAIVSAGVSSQVIQRKIEGTVWYDSNNNGVKESTETLASNVTVSITDEDGQQVKDVNGNIISSVKTDSNGYYSFTDLPKENYYLKVQMPESKYTLTEKEVGDNTLVNSKFDTSSNETELITRLNSFDLPELTVSNINAGLVKKETNVIVNYKDVDTDENLLSEETINGRVDDDYTTEDKINEINAKFSNKYELAKIDGNTTGTMTEDAIYVTYYYKKIYGSVTITKVDNQDNTKVLSGATFKVKSKNDDSYDSELTTDSNGKVVFENLEVGSYVLTEIKAPSGYELNGNEVDIEITQEQTELELTFSDRKKIELPVTGISRNEAILIVIAILIALTIIRIIIYRIKVRKIKKEKIKDKKKN